MTIRIEKLSIRAGSFHVDGIDLTVDEGEYAVLMGRSGCGKTTLIETLCGLRPATGGRIVLAETDVTDLHPAARRIGYVPQDGALFPAMRVRDQLGFASMMRRQPRAEVRARIAALAELLQIEDILDRKPRGLSGGERQRVALGRALAAEPRVVLLDEPLSALDDDSRGQMYDVLDQACRARGVTTLHVTHNRAEADRLGHRIFRLEPERDDGNVCFTDTP